MTEYNKRPSLTPMEDVQLKATTEEPLNNSENKPINLNLFMEQLRRTILPINRLDYYGNAIPIGAFCNAISFIIFGFTRCHVFDDNHYFLQGIILIFGGLGQITAGLLEYLKIRSYSALLYLTLGFYSFSHYFLEDYRREKNDDDVPNIDNYLNVKNGNHEEVAFYYGAWFIIILPLVAASIKINVFFLVQTCATFFFFLFRWIGEVSEKSQLYNYTSGIFQLIAGFTSLYIFTYQILDEQMKMQILPAVPFKADNDIDYNIVINNQQTPS